MSQIDQHPAYFDLNGAMSFSGLKKSSIYCLLAEGKIRAKKFGKKTLFERESFVELLASLPDFQRAA